MAGLVRKDGTEGNDLMRSTAYDFNLWGGKGEDLLIGYAGVDLLYGGDDDDALWGGDGDDYLFGDDVKSTNFGDDWLYGDAGKDVLVGDKGKDRLFGGTGDDALYGGDGDDTLTGDKGKDTLTGGNGKDTFAFIHKTDSTKTARDTITDFKRGTDKIDVSQLKLTAENLVIVKAGANIFQFSNQSNQSDILVEVTLTNVTKLDRNVDFVFA
jgi:Ca2+-binding RTX toxin-like protein